MDALPTHIAIIGDTQETTFVERVILRREHNLAETRQVLEALAATNPEAVLMLGDFVSYGFSDRDWKKFDQLVSPLRKKNIPVLGLLGNHDYWGGGDCLPNAYARFPELKRSHWYVKEYAPLAFVFLDTNRKNLGAAKWKAQLTWLRATLARLEQDPKIKGHFVLGHHPPFSNSDLTGDDADVKTAIVPELERSKKGLGYISGHAHGYEHFEKAGKHYIVSGGGGGPRVHYESRHADLY